MSPVTHYDRDDLVRGLRAVGVEAGDTVFSHVGLGMLGLPAGVDDEGGAHAMLDEAFAEVLGPEGTLVVPTYSYSYCEAELYDPAETPSTVGAFTEYFRGLPDVRRSIDPIFSVAARGPGADALLDGLPHECFGLDCVYDRLHRVDAKLCNIGVGFRYATFVHHVEAWHGVPYRFHKAFHGRSRLGGRIETQRWVYYVRALSDNSWPDLRRLEEAARERELVRSAEVGRGEVTCIGLEALWSLALENLERDSWFLAAGPAVDVLEAERERVPPRTFAVELPRSPEPMDVVDRLWRLPRDLVSDGYDAALSALAQRYDIQVRRLASGSRIGDELVPERWICREAYVEAPDGRRILDYAENPLCVASYSAPFDGTVDRDTLLEHLYVDPDRPAATPHRSLLRGWGWGFCAPAALRDALEPGEYRVVLDADRSYGALTIGELAVPGRQPYEILLVARLSGPAQADAGMSGVAVALEAATRLARGPTTRWSYRVLLVPEAVGLPAYFALEPDAPDRVRTGLYLDHLGTDARHVLRSSSAGNTLYDSLWESAVERRVRGTIVGHGALPPGEESALEARRVPGFSLHRLPAARVADGPLYPEHRTDGDTADRIRPKRLEESVDLVLRMVQLVEQELDRGPALHPAR